MVKKVALAALMALVVSVQSWAGVILLKNGDRISGKIIENGTDAVKINTQELGIISINQNLIDQVMTDAEVRAKDEADKQAQADAIEAAKQQAAAEVKAQYQAAAVVPAPAPAPAPKLWQHQVAAGYSTTNGNTKTVGATLGFHSTYTNGKNVVDIKGNYEYDASHGRMSTQKAYGKVENDYTLGGPDSKWFNTRSVELDHDKYADISYRILPQIGIGYWFWKSDDSKFEVDDGVGYEYTKWNTPNSKNTGNMADIAHLYIDKVVFWKTKLSEELTFYPNLAYGSEYRLRSESDILTPLTQALSWKIAFIEQFNTTPEGTSKKNDTDLETSIQYAF